MTTRTSATSISIIDRGVGMDAEQLATANRRLKGTESFTVAPSKYMGLFVAGHLAEQIGASVSVEAAPSGSGVVSKVDLGEEMVLRGTGFVQEEDAPKEPIDQSLGSLLSMHRKLSAREGTSTDRSSTDSWPAVSETAERRGATNRTVAGRADAPDGPATDRCARSTEAAVAPPKRFGES